MSSNRHEEAIDQLIEEIHKKQMVQIGIDPEQERWAKACLEACEGLTIDALKAGVVKTAVQNMFEDSNRIRSDAGKKPMKKEDAMFHGVKVWEVIT